MQPFLKSTFRWYRKSSSDQAFLRLYRNDPLRARAFPLTWGTAYYRWYDAIYKRPRVDRRISILQGTKDTVVDWGFNIPFLQERTVDVDLELIETGRHHLMNEAEPIRTRFFAALSKRMDV